MKTLSKDARGFIDGVTKYMRSDRRGKQILPKVSALFTKVTSAAKRERIATITSVVVLSESEKSTIARVLRNILEHDVECRFIINPDLLGGMKIQVADWIVDSSLSSQLESLSQLLI